MIKEEKKAEIVESYLKIRNELKAVKKTADKFDISERSVYRILRERDIPKPSKTDNEDYSDEFCAEYPIYDSENNRYVARLDHVKSSREKKNFDELEVFNEDDEEIINNPIVIAEKLTQYGFRDITGIERLVNLVKYIQGRSGIDVCGEFERYLFYLVRDVESDQLKRDIMEIRKGNLNVFNSGSGNNIKDDMEKILLEMTKNLLVEKFSSDSEEEITIPESPKPEPKQFQNEEFMESFLALTNPMLYRILMIQKGKQDPLLAVIKQYNFINKAKKEKFSKIRDGKIGN